MVIEQGPGIHVQEHITFQWRMVTSGVKYNHNLNYGEKNK